MLTARQAADYLLARGEAAGEPLSPRELQTLCFYAQGFHLGVWAEPLFSDDVLASDDGPMVQRLEEACAPRSAATPPDPNRRAVRKILDGVYDERRSLAAAEQRWRRANACRRGERIPQDQIMAAFLTWAREWAGPPPQPAPQSEVRRILADAGAQARAQRGDNDVAAGRIRPLE